MANNNGKTKSMSSREGIQWLRDKLGIDARGITRIELVADMSDDIMRYTVEGVGLIETSADEPYYINKRTSCDMRRGTPND